MKKKLSIARETIRQLGELELYRAGGAALPISKDDGVCDQTFGPDCPSWNEPTCPMPATHTPGCKP